MKAAASRLSLASVMGPRRPGAIPSRPSGSANVWPGRSRDARDVTVLAVARRYGPSWHRVMGLVLAEANCSPVTAGAVRAAVRRWLPNARHVVDRFHVARDLAKVLVSARRGPPRTPEASPTTRSCLATAFRS